MDFSQFLHCLSPLGKLSNDFKSDILTGNLHFLQRGIFTKDLGTSNNISFFEKPKLISFIFMENFESISILSIYFRL